MQMTKKVVSAILAVMMVVSMMAVMSVATASAYDTIGELDAAIRAGGTVVLDNDFTYSGSLCVPAGKTVTLDLAGHTIESTNSSAIYNYGTLTIKDTAGSGEVVSQECCVVALSGAKTTINSGTFTAKDNSVFSGNGTLGCGGCKWYIKGGTFNANIVTPGYVACGIYAPNDDTWNVSGGTFNVTNGVGVAQRAGTVNITGGTFNVTGDGTSGKVGDSRVVVPSGTAIVYDSKAAYPAQTDSAKTTVSAGTFNTEQTPIAQVKNDSDATRVTTTGGTFDKEVDATFIDPTYEYDDETDKVVAKTDLTPEWEWVAQSAGSSYRYKLKLTLKDGATEVFTKEYYPSVVVEGNDFKYVYSTSSTSVKVSGVSYETPVKYAEANGVIMTSTELSKAALAGGSWKLGQDITGVGAMKIADGFKLDGQDYMIKSSTVSTMNRCMFEANTATTKFEFKNVTLDGNKMMKWALAANTANGGNNAGNVIDLDTVTIQNFKSNDYVGAINAFGSSTWNVKDCTIVGNTTKTSGVSKVSDADAAANSGAAIWAGAKATININGGTYDEILLHGGTANVTVDGNATVDTIRFGYTKITEDSTKTKAIVNTGTVGEVVSYTDFVAENVVKAPAAAVGTPDGYIETASKEVGKTTFIKSDNPLDALESLYAAINDGNAFGISNDYLKGSILGVQKKDKASVDADVTSQSGQETGTDIRFVAVLDTAIINSLGADDDYGFVLATVDDSKTTANANFNGLKAYWGNGEKTISAKGTVNTVCGNADYGDPTKDTPYKYVTCAVNGVDGGVRVAARFFVKKDGKIYYAKYAKDNYANGYTGVIAGWTEATD